MGRLTGFNWLKTCAADQRRALFISGEDGRECVVFTVNADLRQDVLVIRDAFVTDERTQRERMADAVDAMRVSEEGISNDALAAP